MICKNCGNKTGFMSIVTDYKPMELWEFIDGVLTRYCQKDSGDNQESVQCASCGSEEIDREGFETAMSDDRPLVIMGDEEWEQKINEFKKEEPASEEDEDEEK
ncbi:MAG: hypothetical protein WCJ46_01630 [bacterium]